jgi:uracil-DNA glycosylase family 4
MEAAMTTDTLPQIADQIRACKRCVLHTERTQAVPGAGNPNADVLLIGEAPGENEDRDGLPFIGRSGQYLNYLLSLVGWARADVFITNVVKCRPPNNRDPKPDEIKACKDYLHRQIALVDPLVVVTIGRYSMVHFFPKDAKISLIHGQPRYADRRAYFPLYHPAAVLRNPRLKPDMEDDMRRLPALVTEVKARRASGQFDAPAPASDDDPQQLTLL